MLGGSLERTARAHAQFMYQATQAAQRPVTISTYSDDDFTVTYREGSYDLMVRLPELNVATGQTADTLQMLLYTRDNAKDGTVSYGQFQRSCSRPTTARTSSRRARWRWATRRCRPPAR